MFKSTPRQDAEGARLRASGVVLRLALLAQAALTLALLCSPFVISASAAPIDGEVVVVDLAMDIDGGAEELVRRAVSYATAHGAVRTLVLQINTDGGYAHNMQAILDLLASLAEHNITTVAFVAPEGARCRSAGAYIFMACDITAMAPGTSVGACMPVDVAGNPASEKVVNAFAAQMRGLAEARGRNATAAHEMVVKNKAFTAEEAHRYGICDIIADDLNDLLARPELGLAEAVRIYFEPDLRVRFLSFISNPLVQSLLMWAAVMLIMIDIFHPTFVMTVIALALLAVALWGAGVMGTSPVAITLVVLGSALTLFELKKPGIGFEVVGLILVVAGVLFAYQAEPFISIGGPEIAMLVVALAGGGLLAYYLFMVRIALKKKPKLHEPERLVGMIGVAKTDIRPGGTGVVLVASEDWTATSDEEVPAGARVRIISVEGLVLRVKKEE